MPVTSLDVNIKVMSESTIHIKTELEYRIKNYKRWYFLNTYMYTRLPATFNITGSKRHVQNIPPQFTINIYSYVTYAPFNIGIPTDFLTMFSISV